MTVTKLLRGDRQTHRLQDEKGNLIPLSRVMRNGPKAFWSCAGRKLFNIRPQLPWISYDARKLLTRLLPSDASVLEFGSGNSTLWHARHFQTVFSVEHDRQWHGMVQSMLAKANLPNAHCFFHEEQDYVRFNETADLRFDFLMIDGVHRSACAHTALQRAKPDSIVYLDNSDKHPDGGDTRLAEETLMNAACERKGRVLYFTDFAPTDLFGNQGMMVLFGRFAHAHGLK
jgi:hypothetical protein